jgi:hypothetical protein
VNCFFESLANYRIIRREEVVLEFPDEQAEQCVGTREQCVSAWVSGGSVSWVSNKDPGPSLMGSRDPEQRQGTEDNDVPFLNLVSWSVTD